MKKEPDRGRGSLYRKNTKKKTKSMGLGGLKGDRSTNPIEREGI